MKIKPVILCGGSGTRLWPISRSDLPKQFIDFKENKKSNTLFKQAIYRASQVSEDTPLIVASKDFRFLISGQLEDLAVNARVFLEPVARNTAPSLAMAALSLLQEGENDPVMAVFPSDQSIDDSELQRVVECAYPECEKGSIVLVGIAPQYPEIGYGYIKIASTDAITSVESFCEKPDEKTAQAYLSSGLYLWNSGIFLLKASTWLNALKSCRPDIYSAAVEAFVHRAIVSSTEVTVEKKIFEKIPSESVDYAVLEKCAEKGIPLKVVPFFKHWTDLGSWKSIYDIAPKNEGKNFLRGNVITEDTTGSLVISTSRPIVVNGLNDVAVVETNDALLVTSLEKCQNVKQTVDRLKSVDRPEATQHRKRLCPWGWYDVLEEKPGFKVKCIFVKPGSALSLQRHKCRAEHWVITSGVATVQVGTSVLTLKPNEHVYIPKMEIHRMTNKTTEPITFVEVQIGDNLSESDIERFEDNYGRS